MSKKTKQHFLLTNDSVIRQALKKDLENVCKKELSAKVIEELGIVHGAARIDIAVVNGVIHGYELKSDVDTLRRLPGQIKFYNSVLDKVTLVVGKNHLHEAFDLIPEWWGVSVAHFNTKKQIIFSNIREAEQNPKQDKMAIAMLLWREEALNILKNIGHATGVKSKNRVHIYDKLIKALDENSLKQAVRNKLISRINWRSDPPCILYGD